MDLHIETFYEFSERRKKYDGTDKCFVPSCNEPAYYEGGDARFYCGMCEKHSRIRETYWRYLECKEFEIQTRMRWDKDDITLIPLLEKVRNLMDEERRNT